LNLLRTSLVISFKKNDEMTGDKILKESNIKDDIAAVEITPLGNYAIGINWNDGHASGIYPYKNIKELIPTAQQETGG